MSPNTPPRHGPESAPGAPRAGSPWDDPLDDAPLTFFDLEMTGLDPARDALVEVSVVRTVGGVVLDRFDSLVHTDLAMDPASVRVHGITHEALAGAPDASRVATRVHELLAGAVPIAHGAALDRAFLAALFSQHGLDATVPDCVLDTLTLARRCFAAPRYNLAALSATLGLPLRRWHRAPADVDGVIALFPRVVTALRATTPRDLWQVRVGQVGRIVVRDSIVAAIGEAMKRRTRVELWVRAHGSNARSIRGRIVAWEHPHALVATGADERGTVAVRGDRVLRIDV